MPKKSLIPNDIRDFLSILSILGFIAIFAEFTLDNAFLSMSMTPLFLIVGGLGVLISGKIFTIRQWAKDGIQPGEFAFLFAIIFGFASMIIGLLLWLGVDIPINLTGFVGILALAPAIFILIDYISKNS